MRLCALEMTTDDLKQGEGWTIVWDEINGRRGTRNGIRFPRSNDFVDQWCFACRLLFRGCDF